MSPRALVVAAALVLSACPASSEESVAVADQEKGVKAKPVDLAALAAARASSDGGKLESELQQARAMNANVKAYANKEGEPTLQDMEAAGAAAPGQPGYDPLAEGANAGSAAPSDLDTLDDAEGQQAWINMQLVEERILARRKSMQACWDNHGGSTGGRMDMSVTVGSDGRAKAVSLAGGSPLRNGQVADCLGRTLRAVRYPEPRGGSISFVYPVKF